MGSPERGFGEGPAPSERLSEILFAPVPQLFGNIAVVESNIQAVRACRLFALGLSPFVVIVGPSGFGKSHLLKATANQIDHSGGLPVLDAAEWSAKPVRSDRGEPLILDNGQDAASQTKLRQNLRLGLERRVRSGRPTLLSFTSHMPTKYAKSMLPLAKDWVVAPIESPDAEDRSLILAQLFQSEGLPASPQLVRLLAQRQKCSGSAYVGLVKRLKLTKSNWSLPSDLLAACGVMNPYFSDESGWDLREAIARVTHEQRGLLPRNRAKDLALYLMLRVAGLSEASVSQFYNISSAEAFRRAKSFEKTLPLTEIERTAVDRISGEIIHFLLQD